MNAKTFKLNGRAIISRQHNLDVRERFEELLQLIK